MLIVKCCKNNGKGKQIIVLFSDIISSQFITILAIYFPIECVFISKNRNTFEWRQRNSQRF